MTVQFGDLPLARRIEAVEAFAAEAFVRRLAARKPHMDVVAERVAGGVAVFAGHDSPLTEAKGLGLHGPVSEDDFTRMEDVFFRRDEPSRVVVCPLADGTLVEMLARRGYRLLRFESMLAMPLPASDVALAGEPEVRMAGPVDHETYASVVAPNFSPPGEPPDAAIDLLQTMLGMESASFWLAMLGGTPAGGGGIIIHEGVALLAGAATNLPYRNRGVHASLHRARLDYAGRLGCDLAVQGAEPGGVSQRNAERRGFRLAYTRAVLVRTPGENL